MCRFVVYLYITNIIICKYYEYISIFLPAAGERKEDYLSYVEYSDNIDAFGYYWTSSLHTDYPGAACVLLSVMEYHVRDTGYRCCGYPVCPVEKVNAE